MTLMCLYVSACPIGTSSVEGAISINQCRCLAGYEAATDGIECTHCAVDTMKYTIGAGSCESCGSSRGSTFGATGQPLCTCFPGSSARWTLDAMVISCDPCESGTYNPSIGGQCVTCPIGSSTFPKNTTGASALSNCVCDVGHFSSTATAPCSSCSAGTYNAHIARLQCNPCAIGSYENQTGQTSCSGQCSMYATTTALASPSSSSCQCQAGYFVTGSGPNGVQCSACALGRYKSVVGAATCNDCPVNTWSNVIATTTCQSCPSFSTTNGAQGQTDIASCSCTLSYSQ
jgi:hypothetical protein